MSVCLYVCPLWRRHLLSLERCSSHPPKYGGGVFVCVWGGWRMKKIQKKLHVIRDIWHETCDMRHVTFPMKGDVFFTGDIQTRKRTSWLCDLIGPVGQFSENHWLQWAHQLIALARKWYTEYQCECSTCDPKLWESPKLKKKHSNFGRELSIGFL